MEKKLGAYEARRKLGQLIEEAYYKKDSFILERSGRPMAVLVPIDSYERWKRLAKERIFLMLNEVWQRNEGVPDEVLEAEIQEALKSLRRESHTAQAS